MILRYIAGYQIIFTAMAVLSTFCDKTVNSASFDTLQEVAGL